jgi:hypothetical protein
MIHYCYCMPYLYRVHTVENVPQRIIPRKEQEQRLPHRVRFAIIFIITLHHQFCNDNSASTQQHAIGLILVLLTGSNSRFLHQRWISLLRLPQSGDSETSLLSKYWLEKFDGEVDIYEYSES